jgi:hypothetical protein
VPKELDQLCLRAVDKVSGARFARADLMATELRAVATRLGFGQVQLAALLRRVLPEVFSQAEEGDLAVDATVTRTLVARPRRWWSLAMFVLAGATSFALLSRRHSPRPTQPSARSIAASRSARPPITDPEAGRPAPVIERERPTVSGGPVGPVRAHPSGASGPAHRLAVHRPSPPAAEAPQAASRRPVPTDLKGGARPDPFEE